MSGLNPRQAAFQLLDGRSRVCESITYNPCCPSSPAHRQNPGTRNLSGLGIPNRPRRDRGGKTHRESADVTRAAISRTGRQNKAPHSSFVGSPQGINRTGGYSCSCALTEDRCSASRPFLRYTFRSVPASSAYWGVTAWSPYVRVRPRTDASIPRPHS
jgi:hypothetical protein